jgi:tetratricopeptide (TPR) repeat protein
MTSYRFKLLDGRTIGPFKIDEINQLINENIITGNEYVQVFPGGEWIEVAENKDINNLIVDSIFGNKNKNDETITNIENDLVEYQTAVKSKSDKDLKLIVDEEMEKSLEAESESQYREFKFSKNEDVEVDYDELESAYQKSEEENKKEEERNIDATRVVKLKNTPSIDKTRVINPASIKDDLFDDVEEKSEDLTSSIIEEEPPPPVVSSSEKTEFLELGELKKELGKELQEAKGYEETKVFIPEKKEEKTLVTETNPKKIKPVVALAFIVLLYFLIFDEEEVEKQKISKVPISSPVTKEVPNPGLAQKFYTEGVKLYRLNTYQSKILSAEKFRLSLENQFNENPSLPFLIRTYAELIDNAVSRKKANLVIYRLIRITRAKVLKDVNVAYGTALFYRKLGKNQAALRTIENFLRVGKPSVDLLCIYGELLLDLGDFVKAKTVLDNLIKLKTKPPKAYLFLTRYYVYDQRLELARDTILEGGKNYPSNNSLMISFAELELKLQNYKSFEKILRTLTLTHSGGEPVVYAKYLELMGILSSLKGDSKKAAVFFKSSLSVVNSPALRSRLGMLDVEGDKLSQALILESKAFNFLQISRKHVAKKEWEEAFKFALEAVDLNPGFLPVELNLADLQVKRGYLEAAILKLESLKKAYPKSNHVIHRLIRAYLVARKFEKAKYEINYISTSDFKKDDAYFSLLGFYYTKIEGYTLAIKFYNKSIRMNPLNDDVYFEMAKIFMSSRKYKEAKKALTEAISLDPNNLDYRSLHSKILFELEGSETAVGYLQDLITENKDDPLLYGNIAIYYYKSGQVKQFEHYKGLLEKLPKRDSNFFKFMIESSELEGKNKNVIDFCKELLKINPGDIDTRMKLANFLSLEERYFEALEIYNSILERMPGYPLTNYYIGKIYLLQNKNKEALEAGKLEVKSNPTIYNGHFIVGEANRKLEEYSLAVKNLEKAISLAPRSVESLMSLGWIKFQQNFLEIARELYIRAKNVEPNNPDIRRELGNVYVGIGQSTLAKEEYEIYLKLAPQAKDRAKISNKIKNLSR